MNIGWSAGFERTLHPLPTASIPNDALYGRKMNHLKHQDYEH